MLLVWGQDGKEISCHVGTAIKSGQLPGSPAGKPRSRLRAQLERWRRNVSHRQEEGRDLCICSRDPGRPGTGQRLCRDQKVTTQKSLAFLSTNNERSEREIKKVTTIVVAIVEGNWGLTISIFLIITHNMTPKFRFQP